VGGEGTALFGDHGVEEHLKEDVAELLEHVRVVAGANRIVQLVGFLDQIWTQGVVALGRVPLASPAKVSHQGERIFKCHFVLHGLTGDPILPAHRMIGQWRAD